MVDYCLFAFFSFLGNDRLFGSFSHKTISYSQKGAGKPMSPAKPEGPSESSIGFQLVNLPAHDTSC